MIDIGHLKNNLDQHRKKLESKGYEGNLNDIISKYESKNDTQVNLDDLKNAKSAVDLVRLGSAALGGSGGGGRPDMAQAGGPNADDAQAAIDAVAAAL